MVPCISMKFLTGFQHHTRQNCYRYLGFLVALTILWVLPLLAHIGLPILQRNALWRVWGYWKRKNYLINIFNFFIINRIIFAVIAFTTYGYNNTTRPPIPFLYYKYQSNEINSKSLLRTPRPGLGFPRWFYRELAPGSILNRTLRLTATLWGLPKYIFIINMLTVLIGPHGRLNILCPTA